MAEKEDFYHDLDHRRRSFCSCQTLAIGLLVLAIVLTVTLAWATQKALTAVIPTHQVVTTSQDLTNLNQKVAELRQAAGASTRLTLTESELSRLLIEFVSHKPNLPFRDLQAQINPDGLILSGTATQILKSNITATLMPKVVDGQVKLELVKIQAGTLPIPQKLAELVATSLENLFTEQLASLSGITVKSIQLEAGKMIISGTVKSAPSPS